MKNNYSILKGRLSLFLTFFLLAFILFAQAEKVTYSDTWGPQGVSLKSQSSSGVSVNFSIKEFALDTRVINGESMQEINLDGIFLPNGEGAPNLPTLSRYIAIPQGSTAQIEIVNMRKVSFQNVVMAPALAFRSKQNEARCSITAI